MKQRRRHNRRKRILTHRREDALFYTHGIFPASARSFSQCSCGSQAFSRGPHYSLDDFVDAHALCSD